MCEGKEKHRNTHQIIHSGYSLVVEVGKLSLLYFKYVSFRSALERIEKEKKNENYLLCFSKSFHAHSPQISFSPLPVNLPPAGNNGFLSL